MKSITAGELRIEGGFVISEILDFEIECKKNEHTMVQITGIIPDTIGAEPVFQKLDRCPFTVSAMEENDVSMIFSGFINTIQIGQEGNCYIAKLEGISSTVLLDQKEKCRSFQDIGLTYKEVVRLVLADTPDAQVIFNIEDKKISEPIYQYHETDWDFLKRIASHLGTGLLPAGISPKPGLYFGLRKGELKTGITFRIEKIWFDQVYNQFCHEPYHAPKSRFICQELLSYEKLDIGDKLCLAGGGEVTVLSARGSLKDGFLTYFYTAGFPESFRTIQYENACIAGSSLIGTVLETRGEFVRVWLDIDQEQSADTAFWYPWLPETGNLMYCMPETGERIEIMFDDDKGSARASRCIRGNGTANIEIQDTSKRYFTSAMDKRMYLFQDSLGFTDLKQRVPLKIEINDASGIDIESSCGMELLAKEGVWLSAGTVSFQAPQEISIVRRDLSSPTVINMCNGFDSVGKYGTVRMAGSGGGDFPVIDSDLENYDMEGVGAAVMASTPCKTGISELEQRVMGTKVDAVTAGRKG